MMFRQMLFTLVLAVFAISGISQAQLAGSYDIGGGNNDYAGFTTAITDLYTQGVGGVVTFNVYGGDYDEWANFQGAIPGASAENTVSFLDASGTARINITAHLDISEGALNLDSCSYLIWDGIDIYLNQVGDSTYKCIALRNSCNENIFRNADMRGAGFTASSIKYGVYMWSTACNNNLFENLHFHRHNTGIRITGSTAQQHTGNIVQDCLFDDVWDGFYLNYVDDCHIRNNDIQCNGAGGSSLRAIDVDALASTASVHIYGNQFHNFVSAGTASFIEGPSGVGSVTNVYNNFFYDVETTGTGSLYAIYGNASGTVNFYFNSLRIGDLTGTGSVYGYYKSSSTNVCNIQNNIFYFAESVEETDVYRGLSAGYYPAVLDNNAYYNDGGAAFQVFDVSAEEYATLADLQANTAFEVSGLEGDPGYTSAADLHILNTVGLVSNGGAQIAGITDDIDGDARSATPDIGADEYEFLAPSNDYAVTHLVDAPALLPELTNVTTMARITNIGADPQTDVPVRLFYNGVQYAEVLVSLASEAVDTVDFNWMTPVSQGPFTLEVQSFLAGDGNSTNDSATVEVQIVGQPMHGPLEIGAGGDYETLSDVVTDLSLRGVDAPVTLNIAVGTYNESISIPAIPGASEINTITFLGEEVVLTSPEIVSGTSPAVELDGADYVTFDNIDITVTVTGRAVVVTNDADHNAFKNAAITGASVSGTSNYGIYVIGGGNDYNLLENLTISGGYWAIRTSGTSSLSDIGNEVSGCTMMEGKYGIQAEYQNGLRIHDCDIQPGWGSAATEIWGINVGAHGANDTTFAYNNRIHNLRISSGSTAHANGITTTATSARVRAYNNFIYDFQITGGTSGVNALRSTNGNAEYYFNSVWLNDVSTTGGATIGINGYYQTGTGTTVLQNNIFRIDEAEAACRSIFRSAGSLTSDNNAVYGTGAAYSTGRDGANSYATLTDWQNGTGQDGNSVSGDPGFVDGSNLHIQPTFPLVNGGAAPIDGIADDIDGDVRNGATPDIGADEYTPVAFAHDYGITGLVGIQPTYVSGQPYVIQADVQNYGSSNETDVPIVLFFDGVAQDTTLLSLTAGTNATVDLDWTAPVTGFQIGMLEAQAFLAGDGYADNDSATAEVTVVGPPMSGIYDLGGGNNDFASFAEAIAALNLRGIDGPVTIDCYEGTYNEALTLTPINGTSFADQVTFQNHEDALLDVVTISSGNNPVVLIDGADFITFDGIDVVCTSLNAFEIQNDADFITLRNLSITGNDSTSSTLNSAVRLHRDGNDNVTLDGLTITMMTYGTRMDVGTGQCDNLEIMNCMVNVANYCIYLDDVHNARVHDNDLQPYGAAGTSIRVQGVYIASLTTGDTIYVYNNNIHNIRFDGTSSSADMAGIYSTMGTAAGSVTYMYNNFISDFIVPLGTGEIFGIYMSSGEHHAYHNSIHVPDGAAVSRSCGAYLSLAATNATLRNNIFASTEADGASYGIFANSASATLSSDHNCFYGTGTGYNVGGITTSNYQTLPEWQGLGHDLNSVAGDPGFLSATDLHIDPLNTLCESAGIAIPGVATDIDGDLRNDPPDIGADEYEGLIPPDPVVDLTVYRDGVTDDTILRWTATLNANSYLIYAGTTPDFALEPGALIGTTGATTFTHVGTVTTDDLLFYVVVASTAPPAPNQHGGGVMHSPTGN